MRITNIHETTTTSYFSSKYDIAFTIIKHTYKSQYTPTNPAATYTLEFAKDNAVFNQREFNDKADIFTYIEMLASNGVFVTTTQYSKLDQLANDMFRKVTD